MLDSDAIQNLIAGGNSQGRLTGRGDPWDPLTLDRGGGTREVSGEENDMNKGQEAG